MRCLIALLSACLAAAPALALEENAPITRSNREAWSAWHDASFPDASLHWPKKASAAFDSAAGPGWDFVGKRDYHKDKTPTALLFRFGEGLLADVVVELRLLKWRAGAWQTLLELKNDGTVTANGSAFDLGRGLKTKPAGFLLDLMRARKRNPGLWISVNLVGSDGQGVSEDALFHYSKNTRRVELDRY